MKKIKQLLGKAVLALPLISLLLSSCAQIAYTGKIYQAPGDRLHYIELGCTYRTPEQRGCADAVKLAGIPNDGEPDRELNRGTWWVVNEDNGVQTIKIRWKDGEISYLPSDGFSMDETDAYYE